MQKRKALAALGIAGLLGVGVSVPVLAADSPDERAFDEMKSDFAARLAEELGISRDRVETALSNVRDDLASEMTERRMEELDERLDEAVDAGDLTQEQADAIRAAANNGVLPGPGLGGPGNLPNRPFGPGMWDRESETSS